MLLSRLLVCTAHRNEVYATIVGCRQLGIYTNQSRDDLLGMPRANVL